MIYIKDKALISNYLELNEFVGLLQNEVYNDQSQIVVDCITDYLYDIWERDEKLTKMIEKYVSQELYSVVVVDISDTADLTRVEVNAFSQNENFKVTKEQELAFNDFCNRYFNGLKPLYNRFAELDFS